MKKTDRATLLFFMTFVPLFVGASLVQTFAFPQLTNQHPYFCGMFDAAVAAYFTARIAKRHFPAVYQQKIFADIFKRAKWLR